MQQVKTRGIWWTDTEVIWGPMALNLRFYILPILLITYRLILKGFVLIPTNTATYKSTSRWSSLILQRRNIWDVHGCSTASLEKGSVFWCILPLVLQCISTCSLLWLVVTGCHEFGIFPWILGWLILPIDELQPNSEGWPGPPRGPGPPSSSGCPNGGLWDDGMIPMCLKPNLRPIRSEAFDKEVST